MSLSGGTGGADKRLISVGVLEQAKENAGRLRTMMSGILARDAALTDGQKTELAEVKAALASTLNLPALALSETTTALLKLQMASRHWQTFNAAHATILSRGATGGYGVDTDVFFSTSSRVVDDIGKAISMELNEFNRHTESMNDSTVLKLVLSVICFLLSIAFAVFLHFSPVARPRTAAA